MRKTREDKRDKSWQQVHELVQKAAADPAGQSDVKDLEEALEYADQEIGATEGNALNIWDTKVRILLKLGRVDEAFTIVQRVLKKDSSFTDFQDIKNSAPYKAWLKKNQGSLNDHD